MVIVPKECSESNFKFTMYVTEWATLSIVYLPVIIISYFLFLTNYTNQADSARNCDTLDEVRTDFKADLIESELFDDLHNQLIELIDARLSKCLRYEMWHANLSKIFARARFGTSFRLIFRPYLNSVKTQVKSAAKVADTFIMVYFQAVASNHSKSATKRHLLQLRLDRAKNKSFSKTQ